MYCFDAENGNPKEKPAPLKIGHQKVGKARQPNEHKTPVVRLKAGEFSWNTTVDFPVQQHALQAGIKLLTKIFSLF